MIPLVAFIIGAFCGASIMWIVSDREARKLPSFVNEANESASEWLRRGQ